MVGFTRIVVLVSCGLPALQAQADWREVVRQAIGRLQASEERLGDYTYRRETVRKEFESDGRLKKRTEMVYRHESIDGVRVARLIARDGGPLLDDERRKVEEKIQERLAGGADKSREEQAWIHEMPDALVFAPAGEAAVRGRRAWVLHCEPRPGYQARSMRAKVFTKVRGTLWIDQADRHLARAEAEVFDTVGYGFGMLGQVEKGTRFSVERKRMPEAFWVTDSLQVRFAVKMFLVKSSIQEIVSRYSEFVRRAPL